MALAEYLARADFSPAIPSAVRFSGLFISDSMGAGDGGGVSIGSTSLFR